MRARLEFELPEDAHEFKQALAGGKLCLFLSDFRERLRQRRKYGQTNETTWDEVEKLFFDMANDNGVDWELL